MTGVTKREPDESYFLIVVDLVHYLGTTHRDHERAGRYVVGALRAAGEPAGFMQFRAAGQLDPGAAAERGR